MRNLFFSFSLLLIGTFLPGAASFGQEEEGGHRNARLSGIPLNENGHMMRDHLRKRVHEALDQRLEKLEQLRTEKQISAYQDQLRKFFRETVDLDSFERTPLNPVTTGRLQRKDYRIEKVIFESLPGFHVTGNLYIPEGEGPFPGILHPCGHTDNGKAGEAYQKANLLLVQNGFVVLCYDPIGQGERKQLLDPKTGKGLHSSTGEHHVLGVGPVLLGRGLSSYMIWDGIRGIDYLQSRPEVDPDRIGCTGNSGGGNMTGFLMALDDRIDAAAPGCFLTTTRRKNEKPGPGDPEQNLFAQIREGLDHPDFAILRAPRPTMILAATKDFVPIEGSWEAFRQAKRIYTKLGYPERVDLIEAPEPHGFSRRLREGAVRFFARWLQGGTPEVLEEDSVPVEKEEDLLCTPGGQVVGREGARTMFDLNRERANELKVQREERWLNRSAEERREVVRKVTGITTNPELPVQTSVTPKGTAGSATGYFTRAGGILLPWRQTGESVSDKSLLTEKGLHLVVGASPSESGIEGDSLLFLDLRDSGLTTTKNWRFYGADQWISLMLGTSYLAMRTGDLLAVAKWFREKGTPVHLHAEGEMVPVAIHAAALKPEWFESITLDGGITSWETVIDSRAPVPHLHSVVHGALRHYDLKDLVELIPPGKVTIR
jgi:cephalosporin-C deacetylase-like acetyl esterase